MVLRQDPEVGLCGVHHRLQPTASYDRTTRARDLPETLRGPAPWARLAACRDDAAEGVDFFVEGTRTQAAVEQIEKAKAVCTGCRVRLSCREWGLEERYGIWGGLTLLERRRLRRSRQAAA